MYPLVQIGPFNLSSGGLLLLAGLLLANWLFARIARARGGAALAGQAESVFLPALLAAAVAGRLWYGLFNLDLYGRTPSLFWALRIGDMAWAGALLGGMLAGYLWCLWRRFDLPALADSAALALLPAQALAAVGLLLSGEAFGTPTRLPWAVPLFGALRHPTQIYYALAALLGWWVMGWLARRQLRPGGLAVAYLGWQGIMLLAIEPLRADSLLLPGGIRSAQVVGLALLLAALLWARRQAAGDQAPQRPVVG